MSILRGIIGLLFVFLLAWIFSTNKKNIRIKNILIMIALQLVLTFLFLQTTAGITILTGAANFFTWLVDQGIAGAEFAFGGIVIEEGASVFFLHVLMPLVFISALIGILDYTGILDFIIKWVGWLISKITGMRELESYMPVATTLLGSPQVFLTITDRIPKLNSQRLFTVCMAVISSAAASMLGSYMTLIDGQYVVIAVFLNFFSGLVIASIMAPIKTEDELEDNESEKEIEDQPEDTEKAPFFQMLGDYITDGFNLAISVTAMVIGFIALISFLNNGLDAIFGITFTEVLGYVFAPIAYIIGVPANDIVEIGSIMATKLLTNEFVGMGEVANIASSLSTKSVAMISTYLVSFANFGTLGIISGAIKAIDNQKATEVAKFSLRLILGGTLAGLLTATIVGFFF